MSPADYVVLGVIALAVICVAVYIIKKHGKGETIGCCGDCSKCSGCNGSVKGK